MTFFVATILFRPTFCSCAVEVNSKIESPRIEYREAGKQWIKNKALDNNIMGLKEDTAYEVQVFSGNKLVEKGSFRTWKTDVPVARTIELDPETLETPYLINEKGRENGWIRYTIKGGEFYNPNDVATFLVDGAEYVLLDNMVLRGAEESKDVINIKNSRGVRVRNCDIAGWGRVGKPDFTRVEGYAPGNGRIIDKKGKSINGDAAIRISKGASEVVVERCYIHDARPKTCSWYYCHPAGSEAVWMDRPDHSTVLRYNDFIGADAHRFNDCVEGSGNFYPDGGFNRDADIYGNFMIFANDDCIELDGGQRNVRCFENRFEGALCGVSTQGCMVSPSFVYNNLFSGMGEEFSKSGQTIKTSRNGEGARCYVFDNMMWGRGSGISMKKDCDFHVYNNTFCGKQGIHNLEECPNCEAKDNKLGVELEEKDLDPSYPVRDLPFILDRVRVSVGLSREPLTIKIKGTVPEGTRILRPEASDWFDAEFVAGGIKVIFHDDKMQHRHNYRGAFIVRTPEGLSRGVSLYAETAFIPPYECHQDGEIAIYDNNFSIEGKGKTATATFKVEKAGRYWCLLYGSIGKESTIRNAKVNISVDGAEEIASSQNMYGYNTWSMVRANPSKAMVYVQHYDFEPGVHTFKITTLAGAKFSGAVLTDSPLSFEPNYEIGK